MTAGWSVDTGQLRAASASFKTGAQIAHSAAAAFDLHRPTDTATMGDEAGSANATNMVLQMQQAADQIALSIAAMAQKLALAAAAYENFDSTMVQSLK